MYHCFDSKFLDSCSIDSVGEYNFSNLENIIESDYRPSPEKRMASNKNLSSNITFVNASSASLKTKTVKSKR
jgi:hypothetical protein